MSGVGLPSASGCKDPGYVYKKRPASGGLFLLVGEEVWGIFSEKKSKSRGGVLRPPIKCRVPKSKKKCLEALYVKGLSRVKSRRLLATFLGFFGDFFKNNTKIVALNAYLCYYCFIKF